MRQGIPQPDQNLGGGSPSVGEPDEPSEVDGIGRRRCDCE